MKLQLDFDNKVVKLEDGVNLKEFIDLMKKTVKDWKTWDIETNTVIYNWNNPITIYRQIDFPTYTVEPYPPYYTVTCSDGTGDFTPIKSLTEVEVGVYNVELLAGQN